MKAKQLVEIMQVSQPTLSRALRAIGEDIVRIGAGPSIQYSLRDCYRGLNPVTIYRVTKEGYVVKHGELIPVYPEGFVMVEGNNQATHSDGLPWWLFDMRPQGFLGRAYASRYAPELGLALNPEQWSDRDVIKALVAFGYDAIGNLLIGEQARSRFLAMSAPCVQQRARQYPDLALAASLGEAPGSSAGGEQPKFCTYTDCGHVLVKFSADNDNPISERWRDLLLAEHLALSVLEVNSALFDFAGQRFLEIPRFDRIGQLGRIGVFSLRALDAEFVGQARGSWPELVKRLVSQKRVEPDALAASALLWAFGTLIGNTDMHHGNLSFLCGQGPLYQLAPAYDMLPMGFAPKAGGAILNTLRPMSFPEFISADTWRQALNLANRFLDSAQSCQRFSANFIPCLAALHQHINLAREQISRMG